MAKKQSLLEKETQREKEQQQQVPETIKEKKQSPIKEIANNSGQKDKQISAKVNDATYKLFTDINKAQGLSNNSALNMIINRYVRENRAILEE